MSPWAISQRTYGETTSALKSQDGLYAISGIFRLQRVSFLNSDDSIRDSKITNQNVEIVINSKLCECRP